MRRNLIKPMKLRFLAIGVVWASMTMLVQGEWATFTYSSGFQNGGVIPDNSQVGWADTRQVSGLTGEILDVNVGLQLSGGWNGDLYSWLVHSTGFAVLLNRVGGTGVNPPGYGDAGMSMMLDDQGEKGDIHWYGGGFIPTTTAWPTVPDGAPTPSDNWKPDGRYVDPIDGDVGVTPRTALLSSFNGLNPNGDWTLFIADVAAVETSTLTSWTLNIHTAAVPEPASLVQGAVVVLLMGGVMGVYRLRGQKRRFHSH